MNKEDIRVVVAVVVGLLLTGSVAILAREGGQTSLASLLLSVGIFLVGAAATAYLVWCNPQHVLGPLPWLLTACAIYFGFGPLVYHFGAEETVVFMDSFYVVTEDHLIQTGLLNAFGVEIVLLTYLAGSWIWHVNIRHAPASAPAREIPAFRYSDFHRSGRRYQIWPRGTSSLRTD